MNSTIDNLTYKIKQIIEQHYHGLSRENINEKVRTQVIPLLISLFFDNCDMDLNGVLNQRTHNRNILGYFQDQLKKGKGRGKNGNKDGDIDNDKENLYGDNLNEIMKNCLVKFRGNCGDGIICETIRQFVRNNQDLSVEDLIKKALSLHKFSTIFYKLSLFKENTQEWFKIHNKKDKKYEAKLIWLNQWIKNSQKCSILSILNKFKNNSQINKKQRNGMRVIYRICQNKQKIYLKQFGLLLKYHLPIEKINNKDIILSNNVQIQIRNEKLQRFILGRMCRILANKLQEVQLEYFQLFKIQDKKIEKDWMNIWACSFVYKTPANFQTSFWRLQNFSSKSILCLEKGKNQKQNYLQGKV